MQPFYKGSHQALTTVKQVISDFESYHQSINVDGAPWGISTAVFWAVEQCIERNIHHTQ